MFKKNQNYLSSKRIKKEDKNTFDTIDDPDKINFYSHQKPPLSKSLMSIEPVTKEEDKVLPYCEVVETPKDIRRRQQKRKHDLINQTIQNDNDSKNLLSGSKSNCFKSIDPYQSIDDYNDTQNNSEKYRSIDNETICSRKTIKITRIKNKDSKYPKLNNSISQYNSVGIN